MVNVALFGLSANPPSGDGGHVGIVRALVKTGRFDEIWILPVYQHMYSSKRNLLPYEHRVEMCRLAFEPESSSRCAVKVQNTEKDAFLAAMQDKPGVDPATIRVGTIDVIKYIKKQHKERQTGESLALSFVLGSDTFADLMSGKWKDSSGIAREVTLEVFVRQGSYASVDGIVARSPLADDEVQYNVFDVPTLSAVSSTGIRAWRPPTGLLGFLLPRASGLNFFYRSSRRAPVAAGGGGAASAAGSVSGYSTPPPKLQLKTESLLEAAPLALTSEWIHPDVLRYIDRHDLLFFSTPEQRTRKWQRPLVRGALLAAAAAGLVVALRARARAFHR